MAILKKIITGGVIIAALAAGYYMYTLPKDVSVDLAQKADLVQTVKVTGTIVADTVETLYAPVDGRISSIPFREGDVVKARELIAAYDITLIENEYNRATAALEANKQGYEAAVAENNNASDKFSAAQAQEMSNRMELEAALGLINALDIANRSGYMAPEDHDNALGLESRLKTIEQDIQTNLSDKAAAEGRLEGLRSTKESFREMRDTAKYAYQDAKKALEEADPESLTEDQLRDLEEAVAEAKNRFDTADRRYEDLKDQLKDMEKEVENSSRNLNNNTSKFSDTLSELDEINKKSYSQTMSDEEYAQYLALEARIKLIEQDLSRNMADRQYNESKLINPHTLKQYESNVDMSQADVTSADYALTLAREGIRADKGGVILEKYVDANAMVLAGTPICAMQPTDDIKVEAMISKFDIDKIAIGQDVDIVLGETGYKGRVSKIFPVAQKDDSGKPKVKIWVGMDVTDTIPTIGLEAQLEVHTREEKSVLSVPFESVYSDDAGDYVYVLEGERASKRYITITTRGNDRYSVTEGIGEGETIITSPFSDEQLTGKYRGLQGG